jgi:hypothetical protein
MKILLKILGAAVVLVLGLALVGFLLPGRYQVERSVAIAAKPEAIYPLVGDLRAWPKWGVWFARDPAMQITYSASTTGIDAWSDWKSKSQGNGRMTVTAERRPALFQYRLEFPDMGMVSAGTMALDPSAGGSTRVTARMEGDLGHNPLNRWFGLFMDRMVGPDFEVGLANLKRLCEAPAP